MARRRVPLAGRRQPRIDVRAALGDDAEFQRGSDRDIAAVLRRLAEIVGGRLVEVRLGRDRDRARSPAARGTDRAAAAELFSSHAPSPDDPAVQPPGRRREDDAETRRAVDDQPDVDRVIVAAADELLGPVERIDQEIGVAVRRDAAGGDFLLGDHRHAGRGPRQRGEDDQLGRAVGLGDRRRVAASARRRSRGGRSRGSPRPPRAPRRRCLREVAALRPSSTRRHPDAAVEADRFRVQIRRSRP